MQSIHPARRNTMLERSGGYDANARIAGRSLSTTREQSCRHTYTLIKRSTKRCSLAFSTPIGLSTPIGFPTPPPARKIRLSANRSAGHEQHKLPCSPSGEQGAGNTAKQGLDSDQISDFIRRWRAFTSAARSCIRHNSHVEVQKGAVYVQRRSGGRQVL